MCFRNLPIEFDEQGKAHLKEGVADPYTYTTQSVEERDRQIVRELKRMKAGAAKDEEAKAKE